MTEYPECQDCAGWCCVSFGVICKLSEEEILRISEYLEMDKWDFMKEYVIPWPFGDDEYDGYTFKYTHPCRFWTQGKCGIHEVKPNACAAWTPLKTGDWDWIKEPITCSDYHKRLAMKKDEYPIWKLSRIIAESKKGVCSNG
jgi:Fe-S-cluster containining protein